MFQDPPRREKELSANIGRLAEEQGLLDETVRRDLAIYLADMRVIEPETWMPPVCHDPRCGTSCRSMVWRVRELDH